MFCVCETNIIFLLDNHSDANFQSSENRDFCTIHPSTIANLPQPPWAISELLQASVSMQG